MSGTDADTDNVMAEDSSLAEITADSDTMKAGLEEKDSADDVTKEGIAEMTLDEGLDDIVESQRILGNTETPVNMV